LFYEHKQSTDAELKKQFKEKLKNNEDCVAQLQELKGKGVKFTNLWEEKIYSAVCILNLFYMYYTLVDKCMLTLI